MAGRVPSVCPASHHGSLPHSAPCPETAPAPLRLQDLAAVRYEDGQHQGLPVVLGTGGFGRVELVRGRGLLFALKRIRKEHVVRRRQQEHVRTEKRVLERSRCPFIVGLFGTFRDSQYVYMLLEFCQGGELWTKLREVRCFEEEVAVFCSACVVEALDYLHGNGIIYRDLKPENLMLDKQGYIKLVPGGRAGRPRSSQWGTSGEAARVGPTLPGTGEKPGARPLPEALGGRQLAWWGEGQDGECREAPFPAGWVPGRAGCCQSRGRAPGPVTPSLSPGPTLCPPAGGEGGSWVALCQSMGPRLPARWPEQQTGARPRMDREQQEQSPSAAQPRGPLARLWPGTWCQGSEQDGVSRLGRREIRGRRGEQVCTC
uniref:Protein kinase domain-containing protein n=1 Tax=Terrapene triunguis TaxID=2587831 RepID=A0A674JVH1_9SAUR